jgi:MFS family permease
MKAIARLVFSYFTGSPVLRACTIGGLALMALDFYFVLTQPWSDHQIWFAILGVMFFFVGSSLMPVMFGRLARSHLVGVLPGGRSKLLLSMFITILLVALPVGILSAASMISRNGILLEMLKDPRARDFLIEVAALTFSFAVLFAGWMYLAMWFLTSQRNMAGLFKGSLVIMLVMFAPAREINEFTVSLSWNLLQIGIVWFVFGAGFLLWPRVKSARARRTGESFPGLAGVLTGRTAGREFDVLLGTSNPWLLVAALALPLVIMTRFVHETPSVWVYFLTIFSTVTGAYSGQAVERSRALWLRGDWSRAALFSLVERSVWRRNAHVLGALALVIFGVGLSAGFPAVMLTVSVPMLVLGTVLSTYLGLMTTRGLRWLEIVLAVAVMLLLMVLAVLVARTSMDVVGIVAMESGLAVLAIVLRFTARRRWTQLDWMMCRPDRALTARGA